MKPVSDPVTGAVTWVDDGPIAQKAQGRAGYDFDPYDSEAERAENSFLPAALLSKLTGDPAGFCSTSREWHILLAAIPAGLKAGTLENIPECPPLWQDEAQYFTTPAMVANVLKSQWPTITAAGAALVAHIMGLF